VEQLALAGPLFFPAIQANSERTLRQGNQIMGLALLRRLLLSESEAGAGRFKADAMEASARRENISRKPAPGSFVL